MAKAKGIFKRAGSPYLWIRYTGPDGKQKKESTKTTLKTEAEYILSKRRKEAVEGIIPEKNKKAVPFSALVEDYLVWAERQRCFTSKKYFVNELHGYFADTPLTALTTKAIEQFQTAKMKEAIKPKTKKEKKKEPAKPDIIKYKKPATINRYMATLKHMLSKAVEWGMVSDEAIKNVRRVKQLEENNKRMRFLSTEECEALLNASSEHLKPIIVAALNTGMRKSEILGLTWDRVDLTHGFIFLDRTKNGEKKELPINGTLRGHLETLAMKNVDGHRHVFHDKYGKPYLDIKRSFQSACRKAGITDFHVHDLRHTFASHLVMAGIDLTTVKELLGHKTLTMTLRYAHLAPAHKVKALEILDARLGHKPLHSVTN